jgi:spermidine/putrescine transport system permease protein
MIWALILAAFVAFLVGPVVLVVVFSFGANPLIGFPMGEPTLGWYRALIADTGFLAALRLSALVATAAAVVATLTGTLAAFGLLRLGPRVSGAVLSLLSLPVLLPPLVVAIAIVVMVVRMLGLPLGVPVVILSHVLITQPFVILIVLARLRRFDWTGVEAARDMGASGWQAFRLVILPQIAPALVGAALIAAAVSLDDFIIASFTLGGGNTVATFVWGKMRTTLDPSINAVATLLILSTVGLAAVALRLSRYRG